MKELLSIAVLLVIMLPVFLFLFVGGGVWAPWLGSWTLPVILVVVMALAFWHGRTR